MHLGHIIDTDLSDDDDITHRRFVFNGQVNNVLCYFKNLDSYTKIKLFSSYCMNLYGCELWLLSHNQINELSTAWRKAVRRVWELPYITHCYLLPLLCDTLPIFDELCRRAINFIRCCVSHDSRLIRSVATNAIVAGRHTSYLGHNVLFCANRYNCSVAELISTNSDSLIAQRCNNSVEEHQVLQARFLSELIALRDRQLVLSNQMFLSQTELQELIFTVCTSQYLHVFSCF